MRLNQSYAAIAVAASAATLVGAVGGAAQASVVAPRITNPSTTYLSQGGTFTVRGTAGAGAVVALHYHRQGTASSDFSIERDIRADSAGNWARSSTLDTDYRVFATVGTGNPHSATVLFTDAPAPPRPDELGGVQNVFLQEENTTLGVQFAKIDGSASSTTGTAAPAGARYVAVESCVRNRGPHGFSNNASDDYALVTNGPSPAGDRVWSVNPDVTTTDGPALDLTNMAVGSLRCGWLTFQVPLNGNVTYLLNNLSDDGRDSATLVWATP